MRTERYPGYEITHVHEPRESRCSVPEEGVWLCAHHDAERRKADRRRAIWRAALLVIALVAIIVCAIGIYSS